MLGKFYNLTKSIKIMKDILDKIEIKNTQKTYSKLSIITSLITLFVYSYLLLSTSNVIKVSEDFLGISILLIYATQVFCFIGVIFTTLSFIEKEPLTWFKWLGGMINVFLFLMIIGSAIILRISNF
jgi:hypothetical protein